MPVPAPFTTVAAPRPLTGRVRMPGDKSISHRAIMLAGLAVGESRIEGLLESADVFATVAALRAFGADVGRDDDATWRVSGVGVGGLLQPRAALDMGNSGTSARLLMGLAASHAVTATFVGDASLSRRPMDRVIVPLARMGADFGTGDRLPLTVRGIVPAVPIEYRLPIASAQVKSAVLLAGLNTPGVTRVIEPVATRDHTERMLRAFGAELTVAGEVIELRGEAELRPRAVTVPGDPSSAAFWLVAATIVPGSDVTIENVLLNPTRTGLIATLRAMGADITVIAERDAGGERVGDLTVRHAALRGIAVDPALAPSMIDEFPALFVAAAFAEGSTVVRGAGELRVKESDRLAAMAAALTANGIRLRETADGLTVRGTGGAALPGGGRVAVRGDHRIAMSLAVAGLHAADPVMIDDAAPVATSYPAFFADLARLTGTHA